MEIFHHYGIKLRSDEDRRAFSDVGIDLQPGDRLPQGGTIVGLDIGELDQRWLPAQPVIQKYKITEFFLTRFSEPEILTAKALCLLAQSQRGYPQPEQKFGFLAETYDLTDYCSSCGIGSRQVNPFRLKSAPVLKRTAMQLNWVFDEFFVSHEVWTDVFKPFGVDCWPVILHKSWKELEGVVQLRIAQRTDLDMKVEHETICPVCGRSKMPLDLRGFAPAPLAMQGHICRSIQYFGSGAQAFNRIVVSAPLYGRIKSAKLRGMQFYPCEPDGCPRQTRRPHGAST